MAKVPHVQLSSIWPPRGIHFPGVLPERSRGYVRPYGVLVDRCYLRSRAVVSCKLLPHNETVAADMSLAINEPPKCVWAAWQPQCSHTSLVPRGENKWMLHLRGLCEDSRWHLFILYWQVLYRWNRQSSTSVIETNKTSVELSLPFDEDYIIEIKPFSDGGDGSSSEQIRIPKISSKSVSFLLSPSC